MWRVLLMPVKRMEISVIPMKNWENNSSIHLFAGSMRCPHPVSSCCFLSFLKFLHLDSLRLEAKPAAKLSLLLRILLQRQQEICERVPLAQDMQSDLDLD